jgi:N-acetylglucosamine malate deacetylase 1
MNILIVAPHPDDEAIGCGGTAARHARRGDTVAALFLTSGELGLKNLRPEEAWSIRENEARRSCRVLGIAPAAFLRLPDWMMGEDIPSAVQKIAPVLAEHRPDRIYLPHPGEWHPDHRASLPILRKAIRKANLAQVELRAYEIWTPLSEHQYVEDITPWMPIKLRALRHHASQIQDWDYVRAVRGLNEFRGAMAGRCRYAEVFQDLSPGT